MSKPYNKKVLAAACEQIEKDHPGIKIVAYDSEMRKKDNIVMYGEVFLLWLAEQYEEEEEGNDDE